MLIQIILQQRKELLVKGLYIFQQLQYFHQ